MTPHFYEIFIYFADPNMYKSDDKNKKSELTGGLGTPLYVAPEILAGGKVEYDSSVDMYSLGIIFIEMLHSMKTKMERSKILNNARLEEIILPEPFLGTSEEEWLKYVM